MGQDKKITLATDDGETIELYVLEETKINGMSYLMVTDSEDEQEDGTCYILKDRSRAEDTEAVYEFVEDDDELGYLLEIFSELLDDTGVDLQK